MYNHKVFAFGFWVLVLSLPLTFAYASVSLSIQSLSPSTNISVGTTVSFSVVASGFTNPSYAISDLFGGGSVSNSNINSSGNFSWAPTQGDIGTHNLTITVSDSSGNTATTQEQIIVSAAPSLSIQSLSPSSTINVGQTVSFTVVPSGFTNPAYSLSDSFNGSTVSNANVNSSGNFSWTPATQDAGSHIITVTVTDASGHRATASESITVNTLVTVVIQSLSPGSTVNQGQTASFIAAASSFSSPSYSLSDSFSGSTISNSNINSSGNFSWTPAASDAGTHAITVTVVDSSGHSATASQTITVQGSGIVIQGLSPGSTVVVGKPVTFTAYASGLTNPVYIVSDSFGGSTVSNAAINSSSGYFNWTPAANEAGTHNVTIWATDSSGHSTSVVQTLVVQSPNITITSVSPSASVDSGTQLSFSVVPAGFTNPSYTISDSYSGTSISNSNINSSGYFTWTPTLNELGTHTIIVYATDSSGHSANANVTIYVSSNVNLTLTTPSPSSTVAPGANIVFTAYTSGFTAPSFALADSFSGTSLINGDISSSGGFAWVPTANDVGTHIITVTATDSYGRHASASAQIVVSGVAQTTASQVSADAIRAQLQVLQNKLAELQAQKSGSTVSTYKFLKSLSTGSTGTAVTELQKRLIAEGVYNGPTNGRFGPLTKAAVKKYQAKHGLAQLGIVGPGTRAALNK